MEDGENLNIIAEHSIGYDIGRPAYDKLARPGQPARPPEVRMIARCVNGSDKADQGSLCGDWIATGDKISYRLQIHECGTGPIDPQPFAEYFPATRSTSPSLAKSPRLAAAIPASILLICQAFSATKSSIALVASQLRERSVFSASRSSASSVASLSLSVKAAVNCVHPAVRGFLMNLGKATAEDKVLRARVDLAAPAGDNAT